MGYGHFIMDILHLLQYNNFLDTVLFGENLSQTNFLGLHVTIAGILPNVI